MEEVMSSQPTPRELIYRELKRMGIARVAIIYVWAVVGIIIQVLIYVLPKLKPYIYLLQKLKDGLLKHPGIIALFLAFIAVGLGLLTSLWKYRALRSYGVGEIMFGALLSFNALLHLAPSFDFAKLFAVGTAIYVVSRGFNNFRDSHEMTPSVTPDEAKRIREAEAAGGQHAGLVMVLQILRERRNPTL
jgi:hypothetical protein